MTHDLPKPARPQKKRILNSSEAVVDARLRAICDNFDAKIYAMPRIADVLPVNNSGIRDELFSYAMKAHFDFVVADSNDFPLLAVEFDGPRHNDDSVKRRDQLKGELCDHFDQPLLRVNDKYLPRDFSGWDLLGWFTTAWFVHQDWMTGIQKGEIHYNDAVFDPAFVSVNTESGWRGMNIEGRALSKIHEMFFEGTISSFAPNWIVAEDKDQSVLRALAWIKVSDQDGVLVRTAMQHQRVGYWVQFAVRSIVINRLYEELESAVRNNALKSSLGTIQDQITEFTNRHQTLMKFGYSGNETPLRLARPTGRD